MVGNITFVSAGAGSGKTTHLTAILCRKLGGQEVRPEKVIATTFTVKAAAELRERVAGVLLEEGRQELAASVSDALIGTVNSVCGNLLKRFSFELGLSVEQNVLDEKAAMREAAESIDASIAPDEARKMTALAGRMGVGEWREQVKAVMDLARYNNIDVALFTEFAARNSSRLLDMFPPPAAAACEEELLSVIGGIKGELRAAVADKGKKVTRTYLQQLEAFERHLRTGEASWPEWRKMSESFPEAGLKDAVSPIIAICSEVASHPRLHEDIREYIAAVFRIAGDALSRYRKQKLERGLVDFADQEVLLLEGLEQPEVCEALRERLDLLLVDEFQDTSPVQLALFLKLSRLARETYWVGDVKQAIYGFRGGDAELMRAVIEFLPEGQREVLGHSWRTVPSLVEAVNTMFTAAFSDEMQPSEIVLDPVREEHPEHQPSLMSWSLGSGRKELQYRALARGVRCMLDDGFEVFDKEDRQWRKIHYSDIAILARTNDHVVASADICKDEGIPVATVRPGLLGTPEAVLVKAALRRLLDRSDTVATAELYSLTSSKEPEVWMQERLEYLASGGDPAAWLEDGSGADRVVSRLARLRERAVLLSPMEALQAVVAEVEAPLQALSWSRTPDEGRTRLLNLQAVLHFGRQYLDECQASSSAPVPTLSGLVAWFTALADAGEDLFPEPTINAVRVMTYHKSKGLEWPVVIMLDLDATGKVDLSSPAAVSQGVLDAARPLEGRFIRFWPDPFGARRPFVQVPAITGSEDMQSVTRKAAEESKRLLYVAMTRARDCLVLAHTDKAGALAWLEEAGVGRFAGSDAENIVRWDNLAAEPAAGGGLCDLQEGGLGWLPPAVQKEAVAEQLSPSLIGDAHKAAVGGEELYGEGIIPADPGSKRSAFGKAVHDIVAFSLTQESGVCDREAVARILSNCGAGGVTDAGRLAARVQEFRDWLGRTWPDALWHVEYPVQQLLGGHRVLKGQIDLLLELQEGFVIIDHKTLSASAAWRMKKALEYSGQLEAYRNAVQVVGGRPVLGCFVHFLLSGTLVSLEYPGEAIG
ncbi:UvrD-helicase domain-containing protein [Prosthecochloris sp. CIB 2401]|uniref:UvrD-helicase domain-containing protein n=1 Tax=Prosthecochloris sp. CIB 2401 TaxID=1868325 RepID=UPI00080AACBC|nr:UvrD-helicase domain-containing protein [Prosthecochloris sp. CIB 2401]ANT64960.1 ATP-dependent helicase/nuclease subunit A [Prosthecochloris sp. CIB 2401]